MSKTALDYITSIVIDDDLTRQVQFDYLSDHSVIVTEEDGTRRMATTIERHLLMLANSFRFSSDGWQDLATNPLWNPHKAVQP